MAWSNQREICLCETIASRRSSTIVDCVAKEFRDAENGAESAKKQLEARRQIVRRYDQRNTLEEGEKGGEKERGEGRGERERGRDEVQSSRWHFNRLFGSEGHFESAAARPHHVVLR